MRHNATLFKLIQLHASNYVHRYVPVQVQNAILDFHACSHCCSSYETKLSNITSCQCFIAFLFLSFGNVCGYRRGVFQTSEFDYSKK